MGGGGGMGKCSKIRYIVRLRQMLRRWRQRAAFSSSSSSTPASRRSPPADVPRGHVAVCVGRSSRRFVLRAKDLNHPVLRQLLFRQAEEDFGAAGSPPRAAPGPLALPSCDELLFEHILRHVTSSSSSASFASLDDFLRLAAATSPSPPPASSPACCCCHVGLRAGWHAESLPLLRGLAEKPVW